MADESRPGRRTGKKRPSPAFRRAAQKKNQPHRWALDAQPGISSVATWEWDLVSGVCRYSPEWARLVGAEHAQTLSPNNWSWWSGRMHMDDMPVVLEIHRRFFEGGLEEAEIIHRLRRSDGRWIRLLSRGVVSEWNDDGTPAVMSGLSLDISHLDLDPPLPEDDSPATAAGAFGRSRVKSGQSREEPDCGSSENGPWRNRAEQRSLLNERRLKALYELTQMEKATDEELLHFALTSILQLTGSERGFLFFPDEADPGLGLYFSAVITGRQSHPGRLQRQPLPKDIAALAGQGQAFIRTRIRNGNGTSPVAAIHNGQVPVMRYVIAPEIEGERVLCLAGAANKTTDYDASDLRQIETFISSTCLILHRRRHITELERAKEAAEAANTAKNEFLANVSHELRTPLNGLLSMLQLLEEYPMLEEQREFLETASLSGNALKYIISDILDYARIESGNMHLVAEPFDFKASVLSSLRFFQEEAKEKGLDFIIELDPDIPDLLRGDETRIRQILFNLVGNSLKFTKEGRITVACALDPGAKAGRVAVLLSVADTGIGIAREKQGMLFNAFARVEDFYAKKYPGTGLGLSIVKRLATMMDGEVRLTSAPGKGTTIYCRLILGLAEDAAAQQRRPGREAEGIAHRPLDILVAEDDAVGRLALRIFLERAGHRVVCADDGIQALEALRLYPFDCLFTDIQMPGMDGLELVRRIHRGAVDGYAPSDEVRGRVERVFPPEGVALRDIDPETIIVAVSAHTMAGDRERFLEQGVHYYLAKPISRDQLNDILRGIAARLAG